MRSSVVSLPSNSPAELLPTSTRRFPARLLFASQLIVAASLCLLLTATGCRPPAPSPPTSPSAAAARGVTHVSQHAAPAPPAVVPVFVDRARELGVDFQFFTDTVPGRLFLPEIMCGGLAWFDFDLDGRLDLYITNGTRLKDPDPHDFTHRHQLFQNRGASGFRTVTEQSGLGHNGYGQGTAVGDFNADGFPDLFVACYGPNKLYVNNGDGTFSDVSPQLGDRDPQWSSAAVWFDFDDDLNLDLYVANYMDVNWQTHRTCEFGGLPGYCGPGEYESQPDWLFVNQGDGAFVESAAEWGFIGERGNGLSVAWADFDDDRRPELYVANDMAPNYLFSRSNVEPAGPAYGSRYIDAAPGAGCAVSGNGLNEASMGIALADYDRDGRLDIYLTHYYHQKNTLYHNLGGLVFEDDSYRTRVAVLSHERLGFGVIAFDHDLDGAQDLFIANGHVLGPAHSPCEMPPTLLRNDGRGKFEDLSSFGGEYFQKRVLGRGVAAADFDNDGALDLAVTHLDRPVALLHNQTQTGRRWIGLLIQTPSRIRPVGAKVRVSTADSPGELRHVTDGGSYYSVSDERLLFGLPAAGAVEIEIEWPSGDRDRFVGLDAGTYWIVRPGKRPVRLEADPP